jgi:hypothetical protein
MRFRHVMSLTASAALAMWVWRAVRPVGTHLSEPAASERDQADSGPGDEPEGFEELIYGGVIAELREADPGRMTVRLEGGGWTVRASSDGVDSTDLPGRLTISSLNCPATAQELLHAWRSDLVAVQLTVSFTRCGEQRRLRQLRLCGDGVVLELTTPG